jgi:NTP pyrophosphatase (non-canonical NTP hydrolase)/ribosomal protein S8E
MIDNSKNKKLIGFIKQLSKTDKKNLTQKTLKTVEEVGELAKVVLPYENAFATNHRFVTRSKIIEELVDTYLCISSIANDLEATDEELEEMIKQKTMKWADLQAREGRIKYPVPYEIHITIDPQKPYGSLTHEEVLNKFKFACERANVKPILLDLHLQDGNLIKDMMTSSVFMGDNKSAYKESERIATIMHAHQMNVVRKKIETIPWHPAAPSREHQNPIMPPGCYFECHLNVVAPIDKLNLLSELAIKHKAHRSRNVFKKLDDNVVTIMVTHRSYEGVFEDFKEHLEVLKKDLISNQFVVQKEIVEFSVYDTKVNHDSNWINGK